LTTLYLVRHAAAEEPATGGRGPADENRALSSEGIRKFRQAARGIVHILRADPPKLILTSPLLRARQTAELLVEACDNAKIRIELQGTSALAPPGVLPKLLREIGSRPAIAVGHEPILSQWIAHLCFNAPGDVELKKGALAALELQKPGRARLLFLIPPAVLRDL
jgi:phosphohistidine phosphatase